MTPVRAAKPGKSRCSVPGLVGTTASLTQAVPGDARPSLLLCVLAGHRADPPQLDDSCVNIDTQRRQLVTPDLFSLGITG